MISLCLPLQQAINQTANHKWATSSVSVKNRCHYVGDNGGGPFFSRERDPTRITCYCSNIHDILPLLLLPHNASHHHDNSGIGYRSCSRFSRGYDFCGHVKVTFRLFSWLFPLPAPVFPVGVSSFAPSCFEASPVSFRKVFVSTLLLFLGKRQPNPASKFQRGS